MAYTATDLTNLEQAIVKLATGSLTVRFTMGDKSIEYGQSDINDMRKLRNQMVAELSTSATRPKFVLTKTDKGL